MITAQFADDHAFAPALELILTIQTKRPGLVPIAARAFALYAGLSRKPLELPYDIRDHLWFHPRRCIHS